MQSVAKQIRKSSIDSRHSKSSSSTGWQTISVSDTTAQQSQAETQVLSELDSPLPSAIDEEPTTVEDQRLKQLFRNLSINDQLILYNEFRLLPQACNALWRAKYKKLDFRELEKKLSGGSLCYFLNYMMDHFKYVYFQADRLQANLNVLEKAGVKTLNSVQHCELLLEPSGTRSASDSECESVSFLRSKLIKGGDGEGDVATERNSFTMAQWPLHALPKLLRNLRRLKVHCDVQVHFIEHFENLQQLILYAYISQTALTGILERCTHLKRFFLKADTKNLHIHNIGKCQELQDISLPTRIFHMEREAVMALPDLQLLELTHCERDPNETLECLRFVLDEQRTANIEIMQLDCSCFDGPRWMRQVGLRQCSRLRGLVLINCQFNDREIADLEMPAVQKYLVFSSCHDLKEYQLLDMVKRCPKLCELYLIDCPQLTGQVLHGIYRIRRSETVDFPLNIVLSRCNQLREDYQKMYANYWYFKLPFIKVERMQEENRAIEDIQIFFYKKDQDMPSH
ncbi:uncharacterized protein Dwil_GK20153 [Drosophila willistoni]|uniref:F-box domain-containing protein n=1 Tax=Drosophila willistoni TaxID=7260 RepID=B4MTF8_DROWI|nr:uncharacterized protein LOC6641186 [Drosophila willistoni]EDW75397.1 uncharacterized protein Dwil_GK20153 [Drosophila willistoni]